MNIGRSDYNYKFLVIWSRVKGFTFCSFCWQCVSCNNKVHLQRTNKQTNYSHTLQAQNSALLSRYFWTILTFPSWCGTLYWIQNILHVISKLFLLWIFTNPQIIRNENFHMCLFVCLLLSLLLLSVLTATSCINERAPVTETKCQLTCKMWLIDESILNVFLKYSLKQTDRQTDIPRVRRDRNNCQFPWPVFFQTQCRTVNWYWCQGDVIWESAARLNKNGCLSFIESSGGMC
jgi:hypothetical protein